ncbi:MAG: hypothetical protein GH143_06645 [Calditrichaeota bacterium]|nr:hypothetical protein [Calditrichota bacterium]
MILRLGLLSLFLFSAPLSAQTPGGRHDSTRNAPDLPATVMFPVWVPPEGHSAGGAAPDTLCLEYRPPLPARSVWLKRQRWLGLGMMVVSGALSYYYHQEAEAAYQAYLTSGDPARLDDLFERTLYLDRRAGWCYLGAEAGLLLVAVSFILGP